MKMQTKVKIILNVIILLMLSSTLYAADIPTVDDLNKQTPQLPKDKEPAASESLQKSEKKDDEIDKNKLIKIIVKDYNILGNERFDDAILKNLIKDGINKELDYDGLINVTSILSNYYRSKGYLATAYLPT